ncbi:MAG: TPM domain-containing protein [Nitrospinota bacterium]
MGRSTNPRKFFTEEEREQIVAAVAAAENRTSGEIRLHIEGKCPVEPPLERAKQLLFHLGMDKTEQRNGVLIYLATASRRFAIVGDEGIHKVVPDNFWEDVRDLMAARFREGEFCSGIAQGIERVGEKLREFFPWRDDDVDELPDEISFGKEAPGPTPDSD